MINQLTYYKPIHTDGLTLSIDNTILDVSLSKPEIRDLLNANIDQIARSKKVRVVSWESYKPGTFRHQTLFRIAEAKSFWLGQGLIGNGTLIDRYRLDFNPNKVADDPNFKLIREFLIRNSRNSLRRIPRFDLAIDIPVDRSNCFLVKDHRLYIERKHGVEFTQYLGSKSSSVGRVKLYNKQAEAKLDKPLTRLELTLDPSTPFEQIKFPTVFCFDPSSIEQMDLRVTDTDRFILGAILQGYGSLPSLGRKTRAKIENILRENIKTIIISKNSYGSILKQLEGYLS